MHSYKYRILLIHHICTNSQQFSSLTTCIFYMVYMKTTCYHIYISYDIRKTWIFYAMSDLLSCIFCANYKEWGQSNSMWVIFMALYGLINPIIYNSEKNKTKNNKIKIFDQRRKKFISNGSSITIYGPRPWAPPLWPLPLFGTVWSRLRWLGWTGPGRHKATASSPVEALDTALR